MRRPASATAALTRRSKSPCGGLNSRVRRALGGAIVFAGLFFGLDRYWVTVLGRADTYAVLLTVIGIWSLAAARRAPRQQPA